MAETSQGGKSPLLSKTLHFNSFSSLLFYAAWPFLPKNIKEDPNAVNAIVAWFTIGNSIIRFFTDSAITFRKKAADESQETKTNAELP